MILLWLIVIPLIAGVLAWFAGRWSPLAARWISLIAASIDFVLGLILWGRYGSELHLAPSHGWVQQFGIRFHLALDGLSLLLLMLPSCWASFRYWLPGGKFRMALDFSI